MSQEYYILNRGCVGNSAIWWRSNRCGYTCNLDEALKVEYHQARVVCSDRPREDFAIPAEVAMVLAERHVDINKLWQYLL